MESLARIAFAATVVSSLLFQSVWAQPTKEAKKTTHLKEVRRIVIDPGHGGENNGCLGYHGVHEKFVTLQIARRLESALKAQTDAEVFLTRREDVAVGLRNRTRYANKVKGDVFISIHLNAAASPEVGGVETFFLSTSAAEKEARALVAREEGELPIGSTVEDERRQTIDAILLDVQRGAAHTLSETLAAKVQRKLVWTLKAGNRGVKQAPFGVLKEAKMPSVVIECGFLTHKDEGARLLLKPYQEKIALALTRAIIDFDAILAAGSETPAE